MKCLCFDGVFWATLLSLFALGSTFSSAGVRCFSSEGERGECVPSQEFCPANSSDSCTAQRADPSAAYNPSDGESREACSFPQSNSPLRALAADLTVMLYPIGSKKYNMYVSWETNDDPSTTGFHVGTYKCTGNCLSSYKKNPPYYQKHQFECLQIHNPNARRVLYSAVQHRTGLLECKDGRSYDPPRCNSSSIMTVVVMPMPVPRNTHFHEYLQTSSISIPWTNLDQCWVTAYNAECSAPVFIKPVSSFRVEPMDAAGGSMSLQITWLPSEGTVDYIVVVTDPLVTVIPNCTTPGQNPPCFLARNTTQVTIERLNASREYSVSVQVVPKCGNFSFAQHFIGCRSETCCGAQRVSALVPIHGVNETARPSSDPFPSPDSSFSPHTRGSSSSYHVVESSYPPYKNTLVAVASSASVAMPTSSSALHLVTERSAHIHMHSSAIHSRVEMNSLIGAGNTRLIDEGFTDTGPLVGGVVTMVTVVILLVASPVVITLFLKRRGRSQGKLGSPSNGSVESSTEGGHYCDMIISHEVSSSFAAVTCSGNRLSVHSESQLSENSNSQGTFEMAGAFEMGGSQEDSVVSSCSEKLGSMQVEMDNDAFETLKITQTDFVEPQNGPTLDRKVTIRTVKTLGRTQSDSENIPNTALPSKKRPRSFSTPHALPSFEFESRPKRSPAALILYSHRTLPEVQQVIQELLVKELRQYNVRTISEDTDPHREGVAAWLEAQMREASAVFCVCNEAFREEWESDVPGISCIVPVFKQLLHGLVSHPHGENQVLLDKLAIVLPFESDIEHVPVYLNNRQKFGLSREDVSKMAKFTSGVPSYCVTNK